MSSPLPDRNVPGSSSPFMTFPPHDSRGRRAVVARPQLPCFTGSGLVAPLLPLPLPSRTPELAQRTSASSGTPPVGTQRRVSSPPSPSQYAHASSSLVSPPTP